MRILILCIFIFCSFTSLSAIYQKESTKNIEIIGDSKNFQVVCYFNDAIITTYFKRITYDVNFNFIEPIKQTFNYLSINKEFVTMVPYETRYNSGYIQYSYRHTKQNIVKGHHFFVYIYYTPTDDSFEASYEIRPFESIVFPD